MKKFLLACAAISLGFGCAFADTYEANFADASSQLNANTFSGSQELTLNEVTWNLSVTKGASNYYFGKDGNKGLQIGSKAQWASSVQLTCDAFKNYAITSVSIELSVASGGKWTGTLYAGNESAPIPGLTTSVQTFTVDAKNATDGVIDLSLTNTAAALYIRNVKVVYEEAQSNLEAANLSFPQAEYTVKYTDTFAAPTVSKDTDAVAVYSSSNEDVATVDAATGAVTIVKPGTTVITAKTEANDKYAAGSAKYTLNVVANAASLEDLNELAGLVPEGLFMIDCPLTVTWVYNSNVYVVDAQGNATLIYMAKADAANYEVGDVLSTEWDVTYSPYYGLPEFVPAGDLPTVTSKDATFDVPEVSLAQVNDSYINKVINIKNVTLDQDLPAETNVNTEITNGDASLIFRNTFGLPAFQPAANEEYNVKGVLSVYESKGGERTLQFLPIEISVASGVASIEANEGVATYYDLNGRQVKGQLANGLYIKVLNGKASKVIVK